MMGKKLSEARIAEIRELARQHVRATVLAARFGVSAASIYQILRATRHCADCGAYVPGGDIQRTRCTACERSALKRFGLLSDEDAAAYLNLRIYVIRQYRAKNKIRRREVEGVLGFHIDDLDAYRASLTRRRSAETSEVFACFDTDRFFDDLDRVREKRDCSWNAVLRAAGLSSSALTYYRAWNPHIQTIVPLAVWAGLSLDTYLKKE